MSPSENEYVDIDMDKNAYEYYKQKDFFLRENNFFSKKSGTVAKKSKV